MSERYVLINVEQLRFLKACPTQRQAEYWAALLCGDEEFRIQDGSKRAYSAFTQLELTQLYFHSVGGPGGKITSYGEAIELCAGSAATLPLDETTEDDLMKKLGHKLKATKPLKQVGKPTNPETGASWDEAVKLTPEQEAKKKRAQEFNKKNEMALAGPKGFPPATVSKAPAEAVPPPPPFAVPEAPAAAKKGAKAAKAADKAPAAPKAPKAPRDPSGRPKAGTSTGKVWELADKIHKANSKMKKDSKELRGLVVEACVKAGINKSTANVQFGKWRAA